MIIYFFKQYLHLSQKEAENFYYMLITHPDICEFLKSHEISISFNDCENVTHFIDEISKFTHVKPYEDEEEW